MTQHFSLRGALLRLALCTGCSLCSLAVHASEPRVTWNIAGTTEGLWNISGGKTGWCNLLEAAVGTRLWKGARLETGAISTYNLNLPVADDLQAFSSLDAGPDKAFRLIQAGISQEAGGWLTAYAGLRNIDMDHFTTPFTGLFTNASHGNFPILSSNFPLATYPLAALCLHLEFHPTENLTLRESVYNGVASDRLDRQFRFCPGSDGVFNIASLNYHVGPEEEHHGFYTLGYACGSSPAEEGAEGKTFNYALWGLVEQPFLHIGENHLGALVQGGTSPAGRSECRYYWGAGLILTCLQGKGIRAGIVVNRAVYATDRETDVELTGSFPVCDWLTFQPALHHIRTNGHAIVAAQLRAVVEFGN